MSFLARKGKKDPDVVDERHWMDMLTEVSQEYETKGTWLQKLGVFWAWAGGFAAVAGVAVVLLVGIMDLFSKEQLFTARTISDWTFWASALLMLFGLLAPSSELGQSKDKKEQNEPSRATKALRRRLRRAYDPWRWRMWGAALLTFGLSALIGLLVGPAI
jgi:hypothetical protein